MEQTRILVVTSVALRRESVDTLLGDHPRWQVVGEAPNWEEARDQVSQTRANVVIVDVPQMDPGFETLIRGLKASPQAPAIVAFTREKDRSAILGILKAGVQACLGECSSRDDLTAAIEAVVKGFSYLCPEASNALLQEYRSQVNGTKHDDPS